MIIKMKEYYSIIKGEVVTEVESKHPEESLLTPFEQLAKKMQNEITNALDLNLDFNEMYRVIDR